MLNPIEKSMMNERENIVFGTKLLAIYGRRIVSLPVVFQEKKLYKTGNLEKQK